MPSTGQRLAEVGRDTETFLPVASAFKAFVLGAYLELIPQDEWIFDRSSDLFNMVVYSHNLATGRLLHLVAEELRRQGKGEDGENDLVLFNDYLEERSLPRMIGSWGFDGPTEGQGDQSAFRDVHADELTVEAANTATPVAMRDAYRYFLDTFSAEDTVKLELFKYMLSLRDVRFLSPLESDFLQFPLFSKDGYLTAGTFPGLGSTRVDAGCIDLPDGSQIIVNLTSFNESDTVANEVADAVSRYVRAICKKAGQPVMMSQWSPETLQLIHERYRYRYTGEEIVDQPGAIVPTEGSLEWISTVLESLGDEGLGGVISVNLSTGEAALIDVDEQQRTVIEQQFVGLVGERLSYGDEAVSERYAQSRFGEQGRYDAESGIMWHQRPGGEVPQHSLSTPMVAVVETTSSAAGFGDLNTVTPVPFIVMKPITGSEDQGYSLTELNSEVTVHAMPELPADDPGFAHYAGRRQVTETINSMYSDGVSVQDGHDPYWSHGCINLLPAHFSMITRFIRQKRDDGKKVVVVLSYQGITDLSKLALPKDYDLRQHPFYRGNLQTSTGQSFSQISR
jgi:hypothetical protein